MATEPASPLRPSHVFIDRRPMWVLLLVRGGRLWLCVLALVAFLGVASADIAGLSHDGQLSLGIFVACLILWITEALPLMITSILALASFPALGILETREAYSLFGSDVTFFLIGVFILASPIRRSGLSTRIALLLLARLGRTPQRLLGTILVVSAALSCVMLSHAVAAMLFTVVHSIARALPLSRRSTYGKALYLSMAWGCIVGSTATLLGSGRAPLAVAILKEQTGRVITFTDWMLLNAPLLLVMLAAAWLTLRWMFPPDIDDIAPAQRHLLARVREIGKAGYREVATALLMLGTVALWMTVAGQVGLATVSLLAVVVAFVIGAARWTEVEEDVNWGIVLMYGGAIALGTALSKSGASAWLAERLLAIIPSTSPVLLFGAMAVGALLLSEAMSNAAVVALFMPPIIAMSSKLGVDPKVVPLFIALPAGFAFILPMGTPATALAFSGGFLRSRDTVLPGLVLSLIALVTILGLSLTWWPMVGFAIR